MYQSIPLQYLRTEFEKRNHSKFSFKLINSVGINSAVIKAISPSNHLIRTYFESKPGLHLASLVGVLRTHFKEKDSASTFTDLSNAAQLATETC